MLTDGDTRCRFGSSAGLSYATVRSLELMQCRTPTYDLPMPGGRREMPLEVTLNGVDFTKSPSASRFTFYDLSWARISHLSPSGGPVRGDTRITVHGAAFEGHGYRGARGSLPPPSESHLVPPLQTQSKLGPSATLETCITLFYFFY